MLAFASWLSAWSLPFTIVFRTVSSVLPVGAPAEDSLVRTMAVPLSRSLLSSDGLRRHSVMRVEMSVLLDVEAVLAASVLEPDVPATEEGVVDVLDVDGEVAAADVSVVDVPVVPATLLLDGLVEEVPDVPVVLLDVEP